MLETEDVSKGSLNTLNYLRFKEFLVEMCLLTSQQANSDCQQSQLAFDLWEIIAPSVDKDLNESEDESKVQIEYQTEVTSKEVTL